MKKLTLFLALVVSLPAFAQRLPQNVKPAHYRIRFVPDLVTETFTADETITASVAAPSNAIVLNSAEIEIEEASVSSKAAKVSYDESKETATLTLAEPVSGEVSIDLRFTGKLNDKLRGFYISRTARRKYAVTQFEATDARRAFPSFDEPAMKATFDISVVVDKTDMAISNGHVIRDEPGPIEGKHTITFATTKLLPTYLIALLVGDFQCSEGNTDGIPIRVCTTPDKVALTKYAVDAAAKELHFLNEWYGIKYPFEKLDIVGIPDFAAGAMENAAALTFRESDLLVDEKSGSLDRKRTVASVLAHEIAHQWFGDLVTMRWWDDIWLNEGFATWMGAKATAAFNPQWETVADLARQTSRTLGIDALASARAVQTHVETPAEIEAVFDAVAYVKTAAVLRMVEEYIGPELFRSGINAYLKKFAYSNASAEDFWTTMAEATKQPLNRVFSSFVLQPGAPLITVSTECEDRSTKLTLTQQRFSGNPSDEQKSKTIWIIPIVARDVERAKSVYRFILDEPSHTFTIGGCSPRMFINTEGSGYFRSQYTPGVLGDDRTLRDALSSAEKISLINDEWALVRAGRTRVGDYLTRIEALASSDDPAVVRAMLPSLESVGNDLTTKEDHDAYAAWVRRVLSPIATKIGWSELAGESDAMRDLRPALLTMLAATGRDADVRRRAGELAPKILDRTLPVDSDLATAILSIAAKSSDAALYDQLQAKLSAAKSPQEILLYRTPLLSFRDPALVRRSLDFAMSQQLRSQDRAYFLASMLGDEELRPLVWPWVKEHWREIEKSVPPYAAGSLLFAMSRVCTTAERDDVKGFVAAHPKAVPERSVRQGLERINTCIAFHEREAANLAAFLRGDAREASR